MIYTMDVWLTFCATRNQFQHQFIPQTIGFVFRTSCIRPGVRPLGPGKGALGERHRSKCCINAEIKTGGCISPLQWFKKDWRLRTNPGISTTACRWLLHGLLASCTCCGANRHRTPVCCFSNIVTSSASVLHRCLLPMTTWVW